MRTVEVCLNLPADTSSHSVRARLLDPEVLKTFHGPGTIVEPWKDSARRVSFVVDTAGSPIRLGNRVRACSVQTLKDGCLHNSMGLEGLGLLKIKSEWTIDATAIRCKARIKIYAPPPFNWIAEKFVALKAQKQIQTFAAYVASWKECC